MEMFYAKGISLRHKMFAAALAMTALLLASVIFGLVSLSQTANSIRSAQMAVLDKPDIAAAQQPHLAKADAVYRRYRLAMIGSVLIAVVIPVGIAVYFVRTFSNPLERLVKAMQRAAEGDLTATLYTDRRDEVGQAIGALNMMVDEFHESMVQVAQSAGFVANSSQELSTATGELSSSAQEQASSLEETAASMEEMTGTVKQNADNALQADKVALEARNAAHEGVTMSSSVKRSMEAINDSSTKIANIIGVIDEIAFQTNLLALNAAVEAARAGEQGRGFAVVAAEVRNLAQRSASAAKEIKVLIQDSVEKVQDGTQLVATSGKTLEGIMESVKGTADLIAEISASSQEQASGIEQVNRAIMQMDGVTQSNTAQLEELSSTSQSLAEQAEYLNALVSGFTLKPDSIKFATSPRTKATPKLAEVVTGKEAPVAVTRELKGVIPKRVTKEPEHATPKLDTAEPKPAVPAIADSKPDPERKNPNPRKVQYLKPRVVPPKAGAAGGDWTEF